MTSIVAKDNTGGFAKFLYDVFSGGAYSRQANALDVLDRDGLGAYNNQMIADARTEIRGDWMAGAYQVGASVSVSTAAKLSAGKTTQSGSKRVRKNRRMGE
ncbi:hypothetical protein OQX63_00040 [Pedobacter sp. PF22-3]|uniref:hypothetical protein n=1 Tax=Pedobacter sp. PF22-3 TaxID=2994467 RepID=UPI002246EF59|nr:hypothetical protein [Pedobacter sp. PF22-3]MCX2491839.1 hypothetical protein [Pedobacter sp. PF22-3]